MDLLTLQTFNQLIQHRQENSLSIYMPTQKAGRETRQNPIQFKNLLSEAQERLQEKGMRQPDAQAYLQPLWDLVEDQDFWQNQEYGLAVFLTPDSQAIYRLPLAFSETVVLNDRFHIKPLLPLFVENERFYVLALSQQDVRLLVGTRFDVAELDLGDTPTNIQAALQYDDPERELQLHTNTAGAGVGGGRGAMFHGHTPTSDELKSITRFFNKVNQGVMDILGDETAPLILAGVDYLLPIYQEANSYPHLVEESIRGNPDELSSEELHQEAWKIIKPRIQKRLDETIERYKTLESSDKTTDQLPKVVSAAHHARVDTLFVPLDREVWGFYDPDTDTVMRQKRENPDSRDLIDYAVIYTLRNGGSVFPLSEEELPSKEDRPLAAIFRY